MVEQEVEEIIEVVKPVAAAVIANPLLATPGGGVVALANAGLQSYTQDTEGSLLLKTFNKPDQLARHKDEAVSYEEFMNYAKGKSFETLRNEADLAGGAHSTSARGPAIDYRYVIDPADPNKIIDMRHFLVVGSKGEGFGLGVELVQTIGDNPSAFDAQDFYSNALGSRFFEQYHNRDVFSDQLNRFFEQRKR